MRWNAWHVLAAVAMSGLMNAAAANAEEVYSVTNEERSYVSNEIASLRQEIASQRAEIDSLREWMQTSVTSGYDDDGDKGDGSCCDSWCGCCNPCCRKGFVGGVEVSWLKVHNSSGTGPSSLFTDAGAGPVGIGEIDPDFDTSYRIWIGYQGCDGLGVRVRYWEFDHSYSVGIPTTLGTLATHGWDTWVFDVEGTDVSKLGCYWDVTLSAGFRHVEYWEALEVTGPGQFAGFNDRKSFTGIGATTGAEFHRQVSCNLGAFASVRFSVLYGDEKIVTNLGTGMLFQENERNDVKYMYEAQAGAEYLRPICGGGWYYARGGFEVQYWDSFGLNQFADDDASIGFAGFFLSAGVTR